MILRNIEAAWHAHWPRITGGTYEMTASRTKWHVARHSTNLLRRMANWTNRWKPGVQLIIAVQCIRAQCEMVLSWMRSPFRTNARSVHFALHAAAHCAIAMGIEFSSSLSSPDQFAQLVWRAQITTDQNAQSCAV